MLKDSRQAGAHFQVTKEMVVAGVEFAETQLHEVPLAPFSVRLLVEGILRHALKLPVPSYSLDPLE